MAGRAVHKYEVGFGESKAMLPEDARLLHVGTQPQMNGGGEGVFVWAEVDPGAPRVSRHVGYFATGQPIPTDAEYVGTAVTPGGAFVWHVYQLVER